MKKTGILGIFAVLLLAIAMTAACVQVPEPDNSNAVITYRFYGGFVMPAYAIQELVVTKDRAAFTVTSSDGNITERFEKNLTRDQFDAIVKVFTDNNFASYGDRYDEGQNHVTDVGFTDITFAANGKSKTVTTYNVNDYMPSGLIRIREKLQETLQYTRTLDESQVRALAESWIRRAPTYAYDGSDLRFVSYVQQESFPVRHVLTYAFTSSHAGYGNRSGQVTAQVITEHTIQVVILDGYVDSAVIDGKWDESGQFLIGSELTLRYQPKMCEKTAWQVWEENSGRVYIRAPTDEEIIKSYYISVYNIEVRDVKKVQLGGVACQACDVCLETYRFELTVNANEMQVLLSEGWVRLQTTAPATPDLTIPGTAKNTEREVTVSSTQKITAFKWGGPAVTYAEFAKAGYTFVSFDTEVKNIGSRIINISTGDFSLKDSSGTRFDPIIKQGTNNITLGYVKDLDKNQTISDPVIFEVPLPAENLVLYYDFGNVSNSTKLASWKIN